MGVYLNAFTVLTVLAAYFLGCFNGSILVSKYILHNDIRSHGSGNAGLTNFYRTFGGALTFVVILSDVIKAVIAVLIGMVAFSRVGDPVAGKYIAALFVLLGHMFPCMFHFKGGKGVLSGGTAACMLDWRIAVIVFGLFLILAVSTKWVSLGSIAGGAAFPVATWFVYHNLFYTIVAVITGSLLMWKHRGNLERILKGEESKFSLRKKEKGK